MPIELTEGFACSRTHTETRRSVNMGKGNNSQKNDKKSMKPKQDKKAAAAKK
ncbi:MAG: hypothetical protein ACKO6B_03980 [Planctomycetia bacterium]